jgi:hypothetical protein
MGWITFLPVMSRRALHRHSSFLPFYLSVLLGASSLDMISPFLLQALTAIIHFIFLFSAQ